MQNINEAEYEWINKNKVVNNLLVSFQELIKTADLPWSVYNQLEQAYQTAKNAILTGELKESVRNVPIRVPSHFTNELIEKPNNQREIRNNKRNSYEPKRNTICDCGFEIKGNYPTCYRCHHKAQSQRPIKQTSSQVTILKNSAMIKNNMNTEKIEEENKIDLTGLCEIHFESIDTCSQCI